MKYKTDIEKMRVALKEAGKAMEIDEVPIGAAIFDKEDNLIAAAHNRREVDQNPVSHAEIIVIQKASEMDRFQRSAALQWLVHYLYKEMSCQFEGLAFHGQNPHTNRALPGR